MLSAQQMKAIQAMIHQRQASDGGLLTFRAGRLFMDENTRTVTADTKRGKIKFDKTPEGLLHLYWVNRISKQQELDLTIFPSSAKWEKVGECTDGRVYLLRMIQSQRKYFFWMQEPKDDKDEEYFTNINKLCNGETISDKKDETKKGDANQSKTPQPAAQSGGTGAGQQQMDLTQMILNAMNNQQNPANNNASGDQANASGAQGAGNEQNLYAAMANMMRQQQRDQAEELKKEPELEDVLDPTANQEIRELLDDEKLVEELAQHLPENMRSRQDIIEQLQCPQFQGTLRRLQTAINGPQMTTLLQQMGVPPPANDQRQMGVSSFLGAVQDDVNKKENKDKGNDDDKEKNKEKGKDEDNDATMTDKTDKTDNK